MVQVPLALFSYGVPKRTIVILDFNSLKTTGLRR